MASGKELPPSIANAPELWGHNILFWNGFTDLVNSRTVGMETGPIPWQHIWYYCRENELDDDQTDDMLFFVRSLDADQLNKGKAARDKKVAKDQAKSKRQPRQPRNG